MQVIRIFSVIIGVGMALNALIISLVSNFNIGNLLTLLFGAMMIFCGACCENIAPVIKWAMVAIIVGVALTSAVIAIYGQCDNVNYDEDAVIVLGAALHGEDISSPLLYRLNATVRYHEKNPDAIIIVTGGQGAQEDMAESTAMKEYLVQKGVPESLIKEENRASSTAENMSFSKEILIQYFDENCKCVVITNQFHVLRATLIAKKCNLNVTHYHAGLRLYNLLPCYMRECVALAKQLVIG